MAEEKIKYQQIRYPKSIMPYDYDTNTIKRIHISYYM